jgi:aspartyl-tRNA(Asn)/glutamyl-tRNA(Gln) amidotransferase subunit B
MLDSGGDPRSIAEERDLLQISDEADLAGLVSEVLAGHPDEVSRIADGEAKLVGFLVGRVMQLSGGKADPRVVDRLVREQTGA